MDLRSTDMDEKHDISAALLAGAGSLAYCVFSMA
jgi:hypothetical protein